MSSTATPQDSTELRQRTTASAPSPPASASGNDAPPSVALSIGPKGTPVIVDLMPYQKETWLFGTIVFMASTARISSSSYAGMWWGLDSPAHPMHWTAAVLSPWITAGLCGATALYTTYVRGRNPDALAHAMQRVAVNLVWSAVVVRVLAGPLGLPVCLPIANAIASMLAMREEALVWLRRSLHLRAEAKFVAQVRADAAAAAASGTGAAPTATSTPPKKEDEEEIDEHSIKDNVDWALFFALLLFGLYEILETGLASFVFYRSHTETLLSVALGYAGWWLAYVQWYQRPGAPARAAFPGNYHDYSREQPAAGLAEVKKSK
ncbi:hypothetical protein H9P43_004064 [Blastocladiella emersonii ATCC 22665]|nr:hypothetical protein H9P43_004064 [Blastocladiella emersonii ATCC 22665]